MASAFLFCIACGISGAPTWAAQKQKEQEPEQALYLVARSNMGDPYFQHSVVLMLPVTGIPLVAGVIVNKPTRILLRELFPHNPGLKNQGATAYFGGPVDVREPSVIFSSSQVPKQAIRLSGGVYLSFDHKLMDKLLNSGPGQNMRLFLGRAQWAPAQLQGEMLQGAWYSLRAESNLVFSADSGRLWRMLLERARPGNFVEYRLPTLLHGGG